MTSNIAVAVTADIADLVSKRAVLSAELKQATKDLNDFAKAAKNGGSTDALKTQMLGAADAVAKTKAQISQLDREIKQVSTSTAEHTSVLGLNRNQMIIAQSAVTRFGDAVMAGANPLKAFALEAHKIPEILSAGEGGMAAGLSTVAGLINPVTIGFAAATVVVAGAAIAAKSYSDEQTQLTATTIGLGAATGLTNTQLEQAASQAANWSGQSTSATLASSEAFAAAGVRSQQSIATLSAGVQTYAALTGQTAADAQKTLAEAMSDPVKGAQELNAQLGILDATQLQQIRTLSESGDKEQAVAIIVQALQQRWQDANQAGVGLNTTMGSMKSHLSELYTWFGKVADAAGDFAARTTAGWRFGISGADYDAAQRAPQQHAQQQAQWNQDSAAALPLTNNTPEARDAAAKQQLAGSLKVLQTALEADTHLHGANSEAVEKDRRAIVDYKRAVDTYIPSAEKAHQIAALDAQISAARRGHDKGKVESLTKQKEALNLSGQVMSPEEAAQRASDAAEKSGASTAPAKGGGASVVSQWEQQLHQQEIASGDYFKDQTAGELAFWQGKLAQTKAGSKDWLDVQAKIYEASKSIAQGDYQDHLADLNARIEADRGSWSKVQADWDEKLAFIRGKFGEESAEYKNAQRQMEQAQRQHDDETMRETVRAVSEQIAARKQAMEAGQRSRESGAQGAAATIHADAASSLNPLAEGAAAAKIAQIDIQLDQQRLAELDRFYAEQTSSLDKALSDAQSKYGQDASRYRELIELKKKADQDYANQKTELEAQSQAKTLQNVLAVRQAYQQSISGMVSATTSGFIGMAARTQTWAGAVRGVYSSVMSAVDQRVAAFVTKWITQHVLMSAAQKAQLAAQTAAHAASEVAQTSATAAGATARSTAEIASTTAAFAATRPVIAAQAASLVGLAGAGGVASMAAAPFPIDLGAPAFGAAMAAAAAGYSTVAAFAKGTNELPTDMIAQIHAGERIVPAADNAKLLAAVDRGTGGGGGRDGDVHVHYGPQLAPPQMSFAQQLTNHASDLAAMFTKMKRDGML